MPGLPLVYTSRSDCAPDYFERKTKWYAERHAPDLIRAGFYSAQSYHSEVGQPFVCNVYEIPDTEVFVSQGYKDSREKDRQRPEVLSKMSNLSNSIYEQVLVGLPSGDGVGVGYPAAAITGPCLTTLRLDVDEAEEKAFVDWYAERELRRLRGVPGFIAVRLCRQTGRHPTLVSHDPQWMVLIEWEGLDAGRRDGSGDEVVRRHEAAFPRGLSRLAYSLLTRVFRLARDRR